MTNMEILGQGAKALIGTSLFTAFSALAMHQTGLDKKVMGKAAPTFVNAAKYGAIRGLLTSGVTALSFAVEKQVKDKWAKVAITIGALLGLYMTVNYTAHLAKKHFGAKGVPQQFTYLAFIAEAGCFLAITRARA